MEFDWTTFILEIINFLILVWILKRFLYRPILDVIARRRAGVEKTLADARRIEIEAGELKQQNEHRLAQWENEKEAAQARLREELAAEREHLMAALETSIAEERERRRVLDERHQHDFRRGVEEQGIAQGAAFSARLLGRAATPELEARLYTLLLEDCAACAPRTGAPWRMLPRYPDCRSRCRARLRSTKTGGANLRVRWPT